MNCPSGLVWPGRLCSCNHGARGYVSEGSCRWWRSSERTVASSPASCATAPPFASSSSRNFYSSSAWGNGAVGHSLAPQQQTQVPPRELLEHWRSPAPCFPGIESPVEISQPGGSLNSGSYLGCPTTFERTNGIFPEASV